MTNKREYYDKNATEKFNNEVKDDLTEKLEEIREDILVRYGFFFDYEDIYLPHINEKIINIY